MGTKTGILIGLGIGYVLGTRAGRERYEQIRANASKLRRFPVVARPLDAAGVTYLLGLLFGTSVS